MATFEQLSPEQRAIIELVLRQGKTYGELSEMLNLPEGRVRELARDALVELAPVSVRGVEEDWRGQLADYVLGQQSGPEATATKGHLRRSEAARSWARSLLDSLEQLDENGSIPQIPDGERGRRSAAATPREPREPRSAMGGRLAPTADRRWLMAGAAALIVILLAVVIWPVGALTGGDDDDKSSASSDSGTQTPAGQSTTGEQTPAQTGETAGIAIVVQQNGKKQLLVRAAGLTPSGQSQGYYVWLYNSPTDARSLGGQVTDEKGNYQAIGPLPADYKNYRFIDISRQKVTGSADVKHSGQSVLRGKMPTLKKATAENGKPAALGQSLLQPPA
jgi:hypothetical protein